MPEAFGASAFRFLGDLAEIGCCRSVVGDWTGWRSRPGPVTNYGQADGSSAAHDPLQIGARAMPRSASRDPRAPFVVVRLG